MEERMLNIEEAAEYLGLSKGTTRKYANEGKIKSKKVNGRHRFYLAWLKEYQGQPVATATPEPKSEAQKRTEAINDEIEEREAQDRLVAKKAGMTVEQVLELAQNLEAEKTATLEERDKAQKVAEEAEELRQKAVSVYKAGEKLMVDAQAKAEVAKKIIGSRDQAEAQRMDEKDGLANLVDVLTEQFNMAKEIYDQAKEWNDGYLMDFGDNFLESHIALRKEHNNGGDKQAIANQILANCQEAIVVMGEYQDSKKYAKKFLPLFNFISGNIDNIEKLLHRNVNPNIRNKEEWQKLGEGKGESEDVELR